MYTWIAPYMLSHTLQADTTMNARFQYLAEKHHIYRTNLEIGSKYMLQGMSKQFAYENKSITLKNEMELKISEVHEEGEMLPTRFIAMTRVSSKKQSLEQQVNGIQKMVRNTIKEYDIDGSAIYLNPDCVTKGGDILWIHEKHGTSAWNKRGKSSLQFRPIGQFLHDIIKTNKTEKVFISELSRLYRNSAYAGMFREQLKHEWKTDADVYWPRNPLGLRDQQGMIAITIQMHQDEEESEVKSERVTNMVEVNRENGIATTKYAWGWDRYETGNITKHKKPEYAMKPNWPEQSIRSYMMNMIENEGASLGDCVRLMEKLGIKGKKGGDWYSGTVTKVVYQTKQNDFLDKHPKELRMPNYPWTSYRKSMRDHVYE